MVSLEKQFNLESHTVYSSQTTHLSIFQIYSLRHPRNIILIFVANGIINLHIFIIKNKIQICIVSIHMYAGNVFYYIATNVFYTIAVDQNVLYNI